MRERNGERGSTANTAESLSIYAQILGVPVARSRAKEPPATSPDLGFIDLPGADCHDHDALVNLGQRISETPEAIVHLVLNAAYEIPLLLEQVCRFSSLPINDLIFTHLDEERRWGKLWNLVLGTRYPIAFLSGGQNVPGFFRQASNDLLWNSSSPVGAACS